MHPQGSSYSSHLSARPLACSLHPTVVGFTRNMNLSFPTAPRWSAPDGLGPWCFVQDSLVDTSSGPVTHWDVHGLADPIYNLRTLRLTDSELFKGVSESQVEAEVCRETRCPCAYSLLEMVTSAVVRICPHCFILCNPRILRDIQLSLVCSRTWTS
jgi:hypothetical protein